MPCSIIVDSGAICSICGKATANLLGLKAKKDAPLVEFIGWRDGLARKAEVVEIDFLGRNSVANVFIAEQIDMPILLGRSDLASLEVLIDQKDNALYCKKTLERIDAEYGEDEVGEPERKRMRQRLRAAKAKRLHPQNSVATRLFKREDKAL